ncbi:hypothetical protein [Jannaschia sp. W003]|uniref:hypothetical protein n=1 Tax=Jannaschia sp. W003 TaxID=2867012 RepID=UPI0021A617CD|nr:hypothetical protein [Jannaschia sp. W003]UWQ20887.1 hypothetical protein K3554_13045 [Jannaschia sp. W003]
MPVARAALASDGTLIALSAALGLSALVAGGGVPDLWDVGSPHALASWLLLLKWGGAAWFCVRAAARGAGIAAWAGAGAALLLLLGDATGLADTGPGVAVIGAGALLLLGLGFLGRVRGMAEWMRGLALLLGALAAVGVGLDAVAAAAPGHVLRGAAVLIEEGGEMLLGSLMLGHAERLARSWGRGLAGGLSFPRSPD